MKNQLVNVPFGFKMAHCFSGKGAICTLTKNPSQLLSRISKVMETLVKNYIMEHLINEKLLADAQHGFVMADHVSHS